MAYIFARFLCCSSDLIWIILQEQHKTWWPSLSFVWHYSCCTIKHNIQGKCMQIMRDRWHLADRGKFCVAPCVIFLTIDNHSSFSHPPSHHTPKATEAYVHDGSMWWELSDHPSQARKVSERAVQNLAAMLFLPTPQQNYCALQYSPDWVWWFVWFCFAFFKSHPSSSL